MKCQNCGAELQDGSLFCRECGCRVETKRFCRDCGKQVDINAKFCSYCGALVDLSDKGKTNTRKAATSNTTTKAKSNEPISKPHTSTKKKSSGMILPLIIMGIGLLIGISIIGFVIGQKKDENSKAAIYTALPDSEVKKSKRTDGFSGDSTYSYKSDDFNVYIAIPVSDNVVKIENWDKALSNLKTYSYNYDVGTYKIDDEENGFYWIDDEHTMFVINFEDKNNSSHAGGYSPRIFTININDADKCKGTNYSPEIACYSFEHDEFHMYRAIPMSEGYMKIECWYKSIAFDSWQYGADVCVIKLDENNLDFEWGNDAFTVTMFDPAEPNYWKDAEFVAFTLEDSYKYEDVYSFINE